LSTREDHNRAVAVDRCRHPDLSRAVEFVLSVSGRIAGVVNPPGGKYGHWRTTATDDPRGVGRHRDGPTRFVMATVGALDLQVRWRRGTGPPILATAS
jgi:hypothetical protein